MKIFFGGLSAVVLARPWAAALSGRALRATASHRWRFRRRPSRSPASSKLAHSHRRAPQAPIRRGRPDNSFGGCRRSAASRRRSADERLRHQDRSWLPPRLERQVPGGRQRRLGGRDQLLRRWPTALAARLRHALHRHRPRRRHARTFALGHPEKLVDFALSRRARDDGRRPRRSSRRSTAAAPQLSYWNGCSTGGRQGLKEAQTLSRRLRRHHRRRAGELTHRSRASQLWVAQATLKDPASYIPPAKYPADPPGGARRVRRARRREGRRDRRSGDAASSIRRCCSARAATARRA